MAANRLATGSRDVPVRNEEDFWGENNFMEIEEVINFIEKSRPFEEKKGRARHHTTPFRRLKTEAFIKEGKELPPGIPHHILFWDMRQDSLSYPGEPLLFV